MERLCLRVVRSRSYHPGDGFVVYGDGGGGSMDWDRPLTGRKVLFWEDAPPMGGHLWAGHLMGCHLDGILPDRHLGGTFLLDRHLQPAATVDWQSDPLVFGRFRFAVVTEDAVGNSQTQGVFLHERVVNSEPAAARDLQPQAFDAQGGRLTLSFTGAERLVG